VSASGLAQEWHTVEHNARSDRDRSDLHAQPTPSACPNARQPQGGFSTPNLELRGPRRRQRINRRYSRDRTAGTGAARVAPTYAHRQCARIVRPAHGSVSSHPRSASHARVLPAVVVREGSMTPAATCGAGDEWRSLGAHPSAFVSRRVCATFSVTRGSGSATAGGFTTQAAPPLIGQRSKVQAAGLRTR
jgi:hypothetical protein